MRIDIMKNLLAKNRVTKNPTVISSLNGTLKNSTSIIDPVIIIEADGAALAEANYLHIPEFKRYYFINDIVILNSKMVEIHAHVDVLFTYSTQIKSQGAIISKQQTDAAYNLYLDDGTFKVYNNPIILHKKFPNSFNKYEYMLAVAGSGH